MEGLTRGRWRWIHRFRVTRDSDARVRGWEREFGGLDLTVGMGRRLLSACPTDFIFHVDPS